MRSEFGSLFSKNLKDLIQKDGRSPSTIAKLAGVNKSTVHNWINGVSPSGIEGAEKLAKFFNTSVAELVGKARLNVEIKISGDPLGVFEVKIEKKLKTDLAK